MNECSFQYSKQTQKKNSWQSPVHDVENGVRILAADKIGDSQLNEM